MTEDRRELGVTPLLLTGRMREAEAHAARQGAMRLCGAGRDHDEGRVIVVATQTLEIGADLDFEVLITEVAGGRALVQRFGRLNRMGRFPTAHAEIHAAQDALDDVPPYGSEPRAVWEHLLASVGGTDGCVDMSPARIRDVIGPPKEQPDRCGELIPAHLWELAKTSVSEVGEPPVEVFYASLDDRSLTVSVVWRAHVPLLSPHADQESEPRLIPATAEREAVDIPLTEFREYVKGQEITTLVRTVRSNPNTVECVRADDPEKVARRLRPGDTVILPAIGSAYDAHGWNADAPQRVADQATLERGVLWVDRRVLRALLGDLPAVVDGAVRRFEEAVGDEDNVDEEAAAAAIGDLRAAIVALPNPWEAENSAAATLWEGYIKRLSTQDADRATRERTDDGVWCVVPPRHRSGSLDLEPRADAFDDLSYDITSIRLDDHLHTVAEVAKNIAKALQLGADVAGVIEEAARFHDIGKADRRFQRTLAPQGNPAELLAKSRDPRIDRASISEWPRGGRHEAISGRLLASRPERRDDIDTSLLLHLVLTHHGHGRPLVPPAEDPLDLEVGYAYDGTTLRARSALSHVDWKQPRRFRELCERYGYWGLALLETIVRQADHIASGQATVS